VCEAIPHGSSDEAEGQVGNDVGDPVGERPFSGIRQSEGCHRQVGQRHGCRGDTHTGNRKGRAPRAGQERVGHANSDPCGDPQNRAGATASIFTGSTVPQINSDLPRKPRRRCGRSVTRRSRANRHVEVACEVE